MMQNALNTAGTVPCGGAGSQASPPGSGRTQGPAGSSDMRPAAGISDRLIRESGDIWDAFHTHPFVTGMADGSLPQEKFRHYMIQDYLYLIDYAKVFALGVAKSGPADMASMEAFAGYVHQILHGEMEIHRAYMKWLGISEDEAAQAAPSLATISYTAYMLRIAYEEGPAEIAASILSCAVSYEVIAAKMLQAHPACARHPFYGEWVQGYADPCYHEANEALKALTDRLAAGYSEEQIRHLSDIFRLCSRFELMFWDMGWNMSR